MDAAASTASSLPELIRTIPRPYRPALGGYLTRKYRIAQRRASVRRELSSYQQHVERGTFPVSIRTAVKVPRFYSAAEFVQRPEYTSTTMALHLEVFGCRKRLLQMAIAQKSAELTFLSADLRADNDEWEGIATNVASGLADAYGGKLVVDAQGRSWLEGMPQAAVVDFTAIRGSCRVYSARLHSLSRGRRRSYAHDAHDAHDAHGEVRR